METALTTAFIWLANQKEIGVVILLSIATVMHWVRKHDRVQKELDACRELRVDDVKVVVTALTKAERALEANTVSLNAHAEIMRAFVQELQLRGRGGL